MPNLDMIIMIAMIVGKSDVTDICKYMTKYMTGKIGKRRVMREREIDTNIYIYIYICHKTAAAC